MTDTDQVKALSQAVLSTEMGRRVGWARAYSAEASKDELSRDVNMLRAERDIMRGAASFMYGFLTTYLERRSDSGLAFEALSRWNQQVDRTLDPDGVRAGRETAGKIVQRTPEYEAKRAVRQAEKNRRSSAHGKEFKAAREQERKLLMRRFGFNNEAEFYNYLEQYSRPDLD